MLMHKVIYPGTFDPVTNGHVNIIERAGQLFDKVIVAVAVNKTKTPLFTLAERLSLIEESVAHLASVEVKAFSNLLIDFAIENNASVIIRGLRAVSDFEFEFQLASMNRHLSKDIETLFLTPSEKYAFVSSSLIREIASLKGNISEFVSKPVEQALYRKFQSAK